MRLVLAHGLLHALFFPSALLDVASFHSLQIISKMLNILANNAKQSLAGTLRYEDSLSCILKIIKKTVKVQRMSNFGFNLNLLHVIDVGHILKTYAIY